MNKLKNMECKINLVKEINILEQYKSSWEYFDEEISKHYENVDVEYYVEDWKYENRLYADIEDYINDMLLKTETSGEPIEFVEYSRKKEIDELLVEKQILLHQLNYLYKNREDIVLNIIDEHFSDVEFTMCKSELVNTILECNNTSSFSEEGFMIENISKYVEEDETNYQLINLITSIVIELEDELLNNLDENISEVYEDVIENLDEDELESEYEIRAYIVSNYSKEKEYEEEY